MKPIYLYGLIIVLSFVTWKFYRENRALKATAATGKK